MKTIKTVSKTLTDKQWDSLSTTYHRGDVQQAIGAAAKKARRTLLPYYVYATAHGYKVQAKKPVLPAGQQFYEIIADHGVVHGILFEVWEQRKGDRK